MVCGNNKFSFFGQCFFQYILERVKYSLVSETMIEDNYIFKSICNILKSFFQYDSSMVVAIVVVIWTFTTSMFVYFLGKVDQRYYGIHVIDIFVKGMSANKIYQIAIYVFGEIVALIFVSIAKCKITLFALAMFQCYMTLYILLMVLERTSREFTIKQVENEITNTYKLDYLGDPNDFSGIGIFRSMLHNRNYNSYDDEKKLLRVLFYYNDNFKNQKDAEDIDNYARKYINICSKEVVGCMCFNREKTNLLQQVIAEWFKKSFIEVKQGILMYMIEEIRPQSYSRLERLLNSEQTDYRDLHIWVLVYNIYIQGFEGEAWRECYTRYMMNKIGFGKIKKDISTALKFWNQITDADKLYTLFKYIF